MIKKIILHFGSIAATARALGVAPAAVSQWVANGRIPPQRAIEIEQLTKGKFKAIDINRIGRVAQ